MVGSMLAVSPRDHMADLELQFTASAQHQEGVPLLRIASLGKDPDSEFEVHFLLDECCFCTIVKSKNH